MSSTEDRNKEIVRRYREEYVGNCDFSVADIVLPVEFELNGEKIARKDHKNRVSLWHDAFPDLHFSIEELIAERDRVVERWLALGTHKGVLWGIPPTGNGIQIMGILVHQIEAGRIRRIWEIIDIPGLFDQLGISLEPKVQD